MSSASPWPPSGPRSAPKIGIYQPAHGRIENALAPKDMETWEHRILLDMDILSASSDLSNFNAPWSQWTVHPGPHVATKLESLELMITSASVKLPILHPASHAFWEVAPADRSRSSTSTAPFLGNWQQRRWQRKGDVSLDELMHDDTCISKNNTLTSNGRTYKQTKPFQCYIDA